MYKKVKQNNTYLAKALASEKAENCILYEQNVKALAGEQAMAEECNARNVRYFSKCLFPTKSSTFYLFSNCSLKFLFMQKAMKDVLKNLTDALGYILPLSNLLAENITLLRKYTNANITPRSSVNSPRKFSGMF